MPTSRPSRTTSDRRTNSSPRRSSPGLDRWLEEIEAALGDLEAGSRSAVPGRLRAVEDSRQRHAGLARNLVGALARAQHDPRVRDLLAAGFRRTRPNVARVLALGDDQAGEDAAGLVLALFNGLLFQTLLDPGLAIEGDRMERAQGRLRIALPG